VLLPSPEAALALTSQEFDAICLMMTPLPALLLVAVPALAFTALKLAVKTATPLGPGALGIFLS
jgi:hypothetical protein